MDLSNNPFAELASGNVSDYKVSVNVFESSALKTTKVIEGILLLTHDQALTFGTSGRPQCMLFVPPSPKDNLHITVDNVDRLIFDRAHLRSISEMIYVNTVDSINERAMHDVQVLGAVPYLMSCFWRACAARPNTDCLSVVQSCEESIIRQLLALLIIDSELDSKEHARTFFNLCYDALSSDDPDNIVPMEMLCDKLFKLMEAEFCDSPVSEPSASILLAVRPMVDELLNRLRDLKDPNQLSPLSVNQFQSQSHPAVGTKERRLFYPERIPLMKLAVWFSRYAVTAQLLLEASFPHDHANRKPRGYEFESGILGRLLVPSHLHWSQTSPELNLLAGRSQQNQYLGEFFTDEKPFKHVVDAEQRNISQLTEQFDAEIQAIMTNLLRVGKTRLYLRSLFFHWLGACITANNGRAQLASSLNTGLLESVGQRSKELASDGFLNNLAVALVRLTGPLVTAAASPPLDKIWPAYANPTSAESLKSDAILPEMYSETRLAATFPTSDDVDSRAYCLTASWALADSPADCSSVPVLTELFFLAHAAVRIGWSPLIAKHMETGQQLQRLEAQWQTVEESARGSSSDPQVQFLSRLIRERSSRYLEQSTSLSMAPRLRHQLVFALTTSRLLVDLARSNFEQQRRPAAAVGRGALSDLPEYLVDNVVELICFLRKAKGDFLETVDTASVSFAPLRDFSILFMRHTRALANPHLRARLAEVLETLLPELEMDDDLGEPSAVSNGLGSSGSLLSLHRLQLMQPDTSSADAESAGESSVLSQAVAALLTAFVSIELSPGTGAVGSAGTAAEAVIAAANSDTTAAAESAGVVDSQTTAATVGFEEKFHYRRPMYACLRFWHRKPFYDAQFQLLESEALKHIDDANQPLFLQFLSLLVNDSIFLLDEAITLLAQLKQKEIEREAAGGRRASENDESLFVHTGRLARYHILLGLDTMAALRRVMSTCFRLVTHPILVDRIACMLNYFLSHLVGPKQRDLTVKDKAAYGFRPDLLVLEICRMYIILSLDSSSLSQLTTSDNVHDADAITSSTSVESTLAFTRAVVADERSFSDNLLDRAASVLTRVGASNGLRDRFAKVIQLIRAQNVVKQEDDLDVGNAPDEYVDPIMGHVMEDPVKLPTSGHIVDRKTIYRHLLNDSTDPFNRQPLAMSQVEPQSELKSAIVEWIAASRSQR